MSEILVCFPIYSVHLIYVLEAPLFRTGCKVLQKVTCHWAAAVYFCGSTWLWRAGEQK